MEDFKLGPIQLGWIQKLKDNPDSQLEGGGYLGVIPKGETEMKFCCLGLGLKHLCEIEDVEPTIYTKEEEFSSYLSGVYIADGYATPTDAITGYLANSYTKLGLHDEKGRVVNTNEPTTWIYYGLDFDGEPARYTSLADANDHNVPWSFLAECMEKEPEKFFAKSV